MKKLAFSLAFLFSLIASDGFSQIYGTDGFIMAPLVEIGFHNGGYEGSANLPPFPTHKRGGLTRLGFVANPFDDGWTDYNGGHYLPGSPVNTIILEVDGTNYYNGSTGVSTLPVTLGLHDYEENGVCKSIEWDGGAAGVDVHIKTSLDTNNAYYIVDVTLTNTTGTDKSNVYFAKTFDPDNNQYIGWGFPTENQVVANPTPFCPKSLVKASQNSTWHSFVGYGAVDPNIKVSRGGFFVTSASDIYNGTGGQITAVETDSTWSDQAISICHKDAVLAAGASSNFQFVVILSPTQVEEAILSLYHIDTDGVDGAEGACTAQFIDVDGDGDLDPVPDTLHKDCAGGPAFLELDGPYLGLGYTITWYNEDTGEIIGTGPSIAVDPTDTTLYKVVASPSGDCFELDIERFYIVAAYGIGPNIFITDLGPQCAPVPIADLIIEDLEMIPGTFMEFYSEYPDAMDDPTDIWDGSPIGPGDVVYVLIGDPTGGCYDVEEIVIEFVDIDAGLDSTGYLLCNSGVETVDLNTFLIDTLYTDAGAVWEEDTPTGGGFDPVTGIFDPTDLAAGDYIIWHIALGGDVCDNDTSFHTLTVNDQPTGGDDGVGSLCNELGFTFDLNTLLAGHDAGGYWEEVDATGGAFDPVTGILTVGGGLAAGLYEFQYIVLATAPCINDTATFTVDVLPVPAVNAGPDQSICLGDETVLTAAGDPATYVWDMGITDGVPFTPTVGTVTYTVTATAPGGCTNTDQVDITVNPLPSISFSADDLEGCTPFQTNFTIVSDVDVASTDWVFGDGDIADDILIPSVSHTYLSGGLYDVTATVTDINGCVSSITYNDYITVEDHPIAAFTMSPQSVYTTDTEVEFTNESLYATDYTWDFGDGSPFDNTTDPTHWFPQDPGDVFYPVVLTASNYLGCTDQATLYMNVKGIILFYIPNTFTPDGDQFNETFQPVFESGFDPYDFHMVVYNRYGEIVFESYDATGGWDGAYGAQGLVQDGVYTWKIDFKELHNDARHTYSGHVTVLK